MEEVLEDEEDAALREAQKTKWAALEKLVGASANQTSGAGYSAAFRGTHSGIEGKGMIVCMSREICVRLYDEITKLRRSGMIPTDEGRY